MFMFLDVFALTICYIMIAVVLHAYWARYGGWLYGSWRDEAPIVAAFWPLVPVLYLPLKAFDYLFRQIERASDRVQEFFEHRDQARRDAVHRADLPEARVIR